eukprot:8640336-Pyramimonas_sp.AAC.1
MASISRQLAKRAVNWTRYGQLVHHCATVASGGRDVEDLTALNANRTRARRPAPRDGSRLLQTRSTLQRPA